MKYVALLRGINVGGNSPVSMTSLKESFTKVGLHNVRTYINSGNVLFESEQTNVTALRKLCVDTMEKSFGFPIDCVVFDAYSYQKMIASAPNNWGTGDKDIRSDALFLIPPMTGGQVLDKVGSVDNEFEWLDMSKGVVFWMVRRSHYTRSRLPKIIGSDVYKQLTMRSHTTARKLLQILNEK